MSDFYRTATIPIIAVRENANRMQSRLEDFPFATGQLHMVDNYLEAVGVMHAIKAGIAKKSVQRPFGRTVVVGLTEIESVDNADIAEDQEKGKRTA